MCRRVYIYVHTYICAYLYILGVCQESDSRTPVGPFQL